MRSLFSSCRCHLLTVLASYVGTLHEINPEASTIALENVVSFGTEGRRGNPAEEIPPSTSIYEYIVFRGSDVKDISVAEEKEAPQPEPPQVPDDPAILGVSDVLASSSIPPLPQFWLPESTDRPLVGANDLMMKYFGCKYTDLFRERKTVWIFPLPSF